MAKRTPEPRAVVNEAELKLAQEREDEQYDLSVAHDSAVIELVQAKRDKARAEVRLLNSKAGLYDLALTAAHQLVQQLLAELAAYLTKK